jgi:hypothetical protein
MTTITLPPVTPAFRDAVRELAMQVGWRNVSKRIAYGPVKSETVAAFAPSGNGHKRNGYSKVKRSLWWTAYPNEYEMQRRIEYDRERWSYNLNLPEWFRWAWPTVQKSADETEGRLALYDKRECCGSPMGVIESWERDNTGQPLKARYQCAVNAAHRQTAEANPPIKIRKRAEKQPRKGES